MRCFLPPRPAAPLCLAALLLLIGCAAPADTARAPDDTARAAADTARAPEEPTVILVSLDGFRWDYPDRYATPNLDRIAARGVRAERLRPVFPTKTFPNHYTLVTGLYPARHGIVSNAMYDPRTGASFSLGDREAVADPVWWGGEPLWVTAEEQGLTAATYFWPGSEAPIQGVRPTYWKPYDGSVPGEERVDQVLAWLDLPPAERPSLITLYFSEVDSEGHRHGPEAPETARAARAVDAHVGRLLDGLRARGLLDAVHVIVVSDHGMATTSPERVILLDEYIDLDDARIVEYSPVLMLRPDPGMADSLYAALSDAHPHLTMYRKGELPERLHFDGHPRTPPPIGLADAGWSITTRAAYERNPERFRGGTHGYDNRLPSMQGIFYAQGPRLPRDTTVAMFLSVDLYALVTRILNLEPAPNDGDAQAARRLLRDVPARLSGE